ncbi:unnamed protein product [Cuscuta europaea]|uniref:Integrase catalytic domain-containing protein n=1 Tax=Cuscuta europaea TaxID=41803 RepID=A0A9P0ZEU3_CUSEU|nr:unnamed protein product [Cuscuta europaea]
MYYLDALFVFKPPQKALTTITVNTNTIWLHHKRLGHPSFHVLKTMLPSLFSSIDVSTFQCDVCELAKQSHVSISRSNTISCSPFDIIHSDVWGPTPIANISGARWYVTFIDDCTRFMWVFLVKNKSEVSSIIPIFCNMIHNQFSATIKHFCTDNDLEYFNQTVSSYFLSKGIVHESVGLYCFNQICLNTIGGKPHSQHVISSIKFPVGYSKISHSLNLSVTSFLKPEFLLILI